jgi:hypothetical protein
VAGGSTGVGGSTGAGGGGGGVSSTTGGGVSTTSAGGVVCVCSVTRVSSSADAAADGIALVPKTAKNKASPILRVCKYLLIRVFLLTLIINIFRENVFVMFNNTLKFTENQKSVFIKIYPHFAMRVETKCGLF